VIRDCGILLFEYIKTIERLKCELTIHLRGYRPLKAQMKFCKVPSFGITITGLINLVEISLMRLMNLTENDYFIYRSNKSI